jgi:toxin ParE1/3/4
MTGVKSVLWSPHAKRDLRQLWHYYARVASADIADRFVRDIDTACARLGQRPFLGRSRDEILPGLRSVRVHPYVIFYRFKNETVEIARLLHERRRLSDAFRGDPPTGIDP